jgi:hypothetical protein
MEDSWSWRVVKPSESDKVSVCEDRGFEEIDVLAKVVEEPHSLCSQPSCDLNRRGRVCLQEVTRVTCGFLPDYCGVPLYQL